MTSFIDLNGSNEHGAENVSRHMMWLQKLSRRITVYYENIVIADTKDALNAVELQEDLHEPVLYLPLKDITAELRPNGKESYFPLRGIATYYDLVDHQGEVYVSNAAWCYPEPINGTNELQNRFAFTKQHFSFEDLPN